jgi:hypothetical protein
MFWIKIFYNFNSIYFMWCELFLVWQRLWKIGFRDGRRAYWYKFNDMSEKNLLPPLYTLKMEFIGSSKRSVNFYRTPQRKIPEDNIFHVVFHCSCTYQTGLLLQYVTAYCSNIYSEKWMWVGNSITLQMSKYGSKIFIPKLCFLMFFEHLCNLKAFQRNSQN